MLPLADGLETKLDAWIAGTFNAATQATLKATTQHTSKLIDAVGGATQIQDEVSIVIDDAATSLKMTRERFDALVDIVMPRCRKVIKDRLDGALPINDSKVGPGLSEVCERCRLFRVADAATMMRG